MSLWNLEDVIESGTRGGVCVSSYQRNQKFLHKNNWSDIKRGWIFEAIIAYTPERPLDFFIPDPADKTKGTVQSSLGNFTPGTTQKAIIELKTRKVLILSNDDICKRTSVYDVTVAPIYGIYEDDREKEWYQKVVKGTHPFFAYLPEEITGMECVIDLTNVMSISKFMLLKERFDITDRMDKVEERLQYCLALGVDKKHNIKDIDNVS